MGSDKSGAGAYFGWFFFGAALGAVVTLLTTPRTGRETRELLSQHSGDVARRAQEWASEAQTQAGDWIDKSREMLEEQTQRIMSAFEASREAMRDEIRKWSTSARG